MTIETKMNARAEEINRLLERYLPEESGYQRTVLEAMNYSVRAGGKRLRPMLMEETYRMFGGTSKVIEPFMAAIEMIHTYSLVHDDLPAMDNDEYRRGKKTTHAVYGEAMGILTGDALLNFAYETALLAFEQDPGNPYIGKALAILAGNAGVYGMVGGQVADVEAEKRGETTISREKLDFIYRLKTGALIEASMKIGAVLAGASEEEQCAVAQVAQKIGLAFQIRDDILDVTGLEEELGKPVGSDERNEKSTYVTYEGLEKSEADVDRLSAEAVDILHSMHRGDAFLCELIRYLVHRRK